MAISTLFRGYCHAFPWILPRFAVAKLITCTSVSMLGEIGVGWRPKTRAKNKLRLNMKKLLNPKLAQKKITVIEESSSQEELEENEGLDVKEMKGKKQVISKGKSALTETKISEMLKEVRRKVTLGHH